MWAITGASGFIGSEVVETLRQRGLRVQTLQADITDPDGVMDLLRGASVVLHLAAYVHKATRSAAQRAECLRVNVGGTENVIRAAAKQKHPPILILMSSASVYTPNEVPLTEESDCNPTTLYGETKLHAEKLVSDAVARGEIRGTILRPAMAVGPGAPGNLLPLIRMVRCGMVIDIASGARKKSIVPVSKVVDAVLRISEEAGAWNGAVFNIGGHAFEMREIVDMIGATLGVHPLRLRIPRRAMSGIARGVDSFLGGLVPSAISFSRVVEAYAMSTVISDIKLRSLGWETSASDVRESLAATVNAWTGRWVPVER